MIWPTGLVVTSRKMDRERFWAYMNEHHSGMSLADIPRAQPLSPFFADCEPADPPPQGAMDWLNIRACYDPTTDRYFLIKSGGYFGVHETYGPIDID